MTNPPFAPFAPLSLQTPEAYKSWAETTNKEPAGRREGGALEQGQRDGFAVAAFIPAA
jgi:hypothetical protein